MCPAVAKKYGKAVQDPTLEDTTNELSKYKKKRVKQIVGSILHCAQAVDIILLMDIISQNGCS